jgi:hypothetical protein
MVELARISAVFCLTVFVVVVAWMLSVEYRNRYKGGLKIVLNEKENTATLWRNLHPAYWRRHGNLILPANCRIEIHPNKVTTSTLLHELGHLIMDIAWLNVEGERYYKLIRAGRTNIIIHHSVEFMAWGIGAQLGTVDGEWLLNLCLSLCECEYGKTKVKTALMISTSTPLIKKDIVMSTRRILKLLSL